MKLATQSYVPALKLGFRDGMAAIKAAGFDSVDMSLFRMDQDDNIFVSDRWETTAYEERSILDELDLPCSQAHAPHIFDFSDERTFKEIAKPRIIRSMKIAKILGAKCIVIHPLHHLDYRREKDRLRRMNHENQKIKQLFQDHIDYVSRSRSRRRLWYWNVLLNRALRTGNRPRRRADIPIPPAVHSAGAGCYHHSLCYRR